MTRKQILIIVVGVIAVIVVILILSPKRQPCVPAALEIWGVYDEEQVMAEFISDYQKQNKCVSITYQKKNFVEYEKELLEALAVDKGPDIWFIHNTWLPKQKDKIRPVPEIILPFTLFQEQFVDVVEKDLTEENRIYGLPLYVDTLALYYNKDFFNSAGISSPPETWEDLIDDLDKLSKKNQWGEIERAGIAIGTANNVHRATDILGLLMLQNGTEMVSSDKSMVSFNKSISREGKVYSPGKDALRFYIDFSNPSLRTYTWNRQLEWSIDAFIEGKAAMILDYAYTLPLVKDRAAYFNFDIAPMPQLEDRNFDVNYANYWAWTVSKKSKYPEAAWEFILYLANKENSQKYLEKTQRPTSRRDLVEWQKSDLELGVFAQQSLTARNWYQIDSDAIEKIFTDAINSVVLGSANTSGAIDTAANQINLLMKKD